MFKLEVNEVINRPFVEVFAYVFNPVHNPGHADQ